MRAGVGARIRIKGRVGVGEVGLRVGVGRTGTRSSTLPVIDRVTLPLPLPLPLPPTTLPVIDRVTSCSEGKDGPRPG